MNPGFKLHIDGGLAQMANSQPNVTCAGCGNNIGYVYLGEKKGDGYIFRIPFEKMKDESGKALSITKTTWLV
jgi:hypothetical protein